MALLGILHPDALSVARIAAALGATHEFLHFSEWEALREACGRAPLDGCVIDPYHPSREEGLIEVEELRTRHASLAIVVYAQFLGREMDLFRLGRLKVDGVIPAGRPERPTRIRETVARALTASAASHVLAAVGARVPPLARDCLRWAIENGHRRPSVREMSEPFSRSARSLARELQAQGAPTPGRLLLWGRLFRASHMLADRGATVERIAYVVGYSSGAALSRAFRRATGHPATSVMDRGGMACVLERFLEILRPTATRPSSRWSIRRRARFLPE